jgi:hypothetical protein
MLKNQIHHFHRLVPLGGSTCPWRDWARHSRFSVLHPGSTQPRSQHEGASFLGQQSIWSRQILLEFYPPVHKTSHFMSHDWEVVVYMEKQSWSEYFYRSSFNLTRTMWLRTARWYNICSAEAVVCDSSERRPVAVYDWTSEFLSREKWRSIIW